MDVKDFRRAFEICRTNKLDLNLIFDINPAEFIANCKEIMTKLKRSDYINLLIASLKNNLSDELEYSISADELKKVKEYYYNEIELFQKNKINVACDLIIQALTSIDEYKFHFKHKILTFFKKRHKNVYSIMTAFIKKEPSELELVLSKIKIMKD